MEKSKIEEVANKLHGIAAKLEVMAAAYQDGQGTPANRVTEAALMSIADEVEEARDALDEQLKG